MNLLSIVRLYKNISNNPCNLAICNLVICNLAIAKS